MLKYCSYKKHYVDIAKFGKSKHEKDGLCRHCKDCRKEAYEKSKEQKLEYQKNYYHNNKETARIKAKEWREKNKDYKKKKDSEYRETHKKERLEYDRNRRKTSGYCVANVTKYNLRKRNAVPNWLTKKDLQRIQYFYDQAKWLSFYNLRKYHVDHIIPLVTKDENGNHIACGLHVPWNLQIIPASENCIKGSNFYK